MIDSVLVSSKVVGRFVSVAGLAFALVSCGGGNPRSSDSQHGPLAGNWQLTLTQEVPHQRPPAVLSVSGFLLQSGGAVTGSVELPGNVEDGSCSGIGRLSGTLSNQTVNLSVSEGGSTISFTGGVSSDSKSMTGTYDSPADSCSGKASSGTWIATKVPPLNLKLSGTLAQSSYMQLLTGISPPTPIAVSGEIKQGANAGGSNATLSGTISAVGYPCFSNASLTGTISGENVVLSVFGFNGTQIGTIGTALKPATVEIDDGGISLNGSNVDGSGLTLGAIGAGASFGPCPALPNGGISQPNDTAAVDFTLQ